MKKLLYLIIFIAQPLAAQQIDSPYEWHWLKDGIWTGTGLTTSAYGLSLIKNKNDLSFTELNSLNSDEIWFFDRWAAGYSSEKASTLSDIPFATSFALPFALLLDGDINKHSFQILGLYLESLATTSALFTITAGLVNKSRPYVYDENLSEERRTSNNGQRSFYSGHVAASATATFFAARVYLDFHPETKGKAFIWTSAALIPATVGYFRIKAGQHFLSDVLIGYGLGALAGIFVPTIHRKKDRNIELFPSAGSTFNGTEYTGMTLRYTF